MNKLTRVFLLGLFVLQISNQAMAQKKPLDHSVYDSWESIGQKQIATNGDWLMYTINPQEGDVNLFLKAINHNETIEIPRGNSARFTKSNNFAVGLIKPFYKDQKLVKAKKLKKEKLAKDTLFVVNLTTKEIIKTPNVVGFSVPKEAENVLAYTTEVKKDSTKKAAKPNDKLKDLYIKDLKTNKESEIKNILSYSISPKGNWVVYVLEGNKKDSLAAKGVFLFNTKTAKSQVLHSEKGTYKGFTFDENDNYLSFYGNHDDEKALVKYHKLYLADLNAEKVVKVLDNNYVGVPKDWFISGDKNLQFSKNAKTLYLGLAPVPKAKDTVSLSVDKAVVDIWGFKDDYIQPIQLKNLDRDLKKSYTAILDLNDLSKIQSVSTIEIPDAQVLNEGDSKYLLLSTDYGKRIPSQWLATTPKTYYIYNKETKTKTEIIKDIFGSVYVSPKANYVVYFDREKAQWFSYDIEKKHTTNLTKNIKVSFVNEENDMPDLARQYGLGYFSESDTKVYIYDRYDIWQFDLTGKESPKIITNQFGRKNKIRFRIPKLHHEFKSVGNQILVTSFNENTKASGLFTIENVNVIVDPTLVIEEGVKGYANIQKAENASYYILTKENALESPNLYLTQNLKQQTQITNLNKQQANYNWHTVELVKWKTNKRNKAEGLLYKPENFDPNKKYPMIVYFYEKNNEELHRYEAPFPTPSRLNFPYFTSNEYIVFVPDISYKDGYPGKSAEEYINSGVKHLIKNNKWINADKIGIQGQSWGGYQVAHLITRTNMYAAAWSGAPVVNMTSAYGGIRWGTGMTRQFQYEKTQSRIGKTLWEDLDLYIENSPLFHFDKVNTPVAIMHNDNDGAVPWYQGIEMYTALRRLNKPVWMLNYNADEHNLMKRENREDIQIRQQQFFDYYLKDAKAPVWMTKGVPATSKGIEWGFELTDDKVQ